MFELKCEVANDTKEEELGIESVRNFIKKMLHELFLYIHCTKSYFQKKEEANEIQRSQKNYFLFITSENIYIFRYF